MGENKRSLIQLTVTSFVQPLTAFFNSHIFKYTIPTITKNTGVTIYLNSNLAPIVTLGEKKKGR